MNGLTSESLEEYLHKDYPLAKAAITEIRELADEVLEVFANNFIPAEDAEAWPYELVNLRTRKAPKGYTYSTTAMILFALAVTTGRVHDSSLVPAVRAEPVTGQKRSELIRRIETQMKRALDGFIRRSSELARNEPERPFARLDATKEAPLLKSPTFGWDDPFTLAWLVEVLSADPNDRTDYLRRVSARAEDVLRAVIAATDPLSDVLQISTDERVSHPFPLLRVLQMGEMLSRNEGTEKLSEIRDLSHIRELLFQRIHLHLSENTIQDSQFDPADLVFSLEAWILSSPVQPDHAIVDRVFQVLSAMEDRAPFWRAVRPFKVTQQGLALLPQSVEVANSLLRICQSPQLRSFAYFSKNLGLFERYSRWLLGRAFRGFASESREQSTRFVGWESDYTYTLNRIHLWETSQALIFLEDYVGMLQQHIADTTLRLAGFRARKPVREPNGWKNWSAGEPLATSGSTVSAYHVYEQIGLNFVAPRSASQSSRAYASFSMLLYGPPGTGKSTVAEKIADELGFDQITVTPSDFIAGGGELVEARAKAIFDALQEQTEMVVLFDEIDALLLDRDSKLYRDQGDVFKLLTPGMLIKLGRLSRLRRVLVIIATNYYERIDRAIKRPGRIDARYLVLPPNLQQRGECLARAVDSWESIPEDLKGQIVRDTVWFTYKELTDLGSYVRRNRPGATGRELGEALDSARNQLPPMISLDGYGARLGFGWANGKVVETTIDTVEKPWEEFALLSYLVLEATKVLPDEPKWVESALRAALARKAVADPMITRQLAGALPAEEPPLIGFSVKE